MGLATLSAADGWLIAGLGLLVITDLCLLAAERQRVSIRLIAFQGILLGLLPLLMHKEDFTLHLLLITAVFTGIKGFLLPALLLHTLKKLPPAPSEKPYVGNTACVAAGMMGFGFSLWFAGIMETTGNPLFTAVLPFAFATVLAGILLIVTRRKALTQIFGYLVMENGIYLLGLPMAKTSTVWLELSVLLDILAGVFVMGIAILHINQAFDSTDVEQFASLRD